MNYALIMRMAGLEPARIATADFESAASAIPPHPQRVISKTTGGL